MSVKVLWSCRGCGKRHILNHVGVGLPHRLGMRLIHRLGWCYPESVGVEPGMVWCHWCGMRGRRVTGPKS